ncbi:MAG: hypothetical protein EXR73_12125 [Myxococcales bacterium]|nr:hypothetical protein [Myxococcales bacterium]
MLRADLERIEAVVGRTRSRLRVQGALDGAVLALVPAQAAGLGVLWLHRTEQVAPTTALGLALALAALVPLGALAFALRRLPSQRVAARLDRASGLADRLATACEFADRLAVADPSLHPGTRALMEAAVRDAGACAERADPRRAAPLRAPADTRPALAVTVVAAVVLALAFAPGVRGAAPPQVRPSDEARLAELQAEAQALEPEDVDEAREYVAELRRVAEETKDPALAALARELEQLLAEAENGAISKEELLARVDELAKQHLEGEDADVSSTLERLRATGKELAKEPLTRRLGEALEAGDMAAAEQELTRLADEVARNELAPEKKEQLARALDKVAKQQEEHAKREQRDDEQQQEKVAKQQDEVRRLKKRVAEQPEDKDARRRLDRKQRELERLERDQKQQQQAHKRRLERLHRNLQRSAEDLRREQPADAEQAMRDAANDAKGIEDEIRKIDNQRKAKGQLADLKEALKRARQQQDGQGQAGRRRRLARLTRMDEWEKRAGGGRGDPSQWTKQAGQGQPQPGQGQPGQRQLGRGPGGERCNDPNGCPGIGDGSDPNLMGDPTRLGVKPEDVDLAGQHGRGPSRREAVLTSAKKGFASAGYRKVFADYRKVVEAVMNREKVPRGYRHFVKRYFNRIKPHSVD